MTLSVANYLGMLQDDPEAVSAFEGLREALESGNPDRIGQQPLRLMEAARHGHERRGEMQAVAWLLELEADLLTTDDPDFRAVLYRELGRLRHEELLDDVGAIAAYKSYLGIKDEDEDIEIAVEELEQSAEKWRAIADRFVQEATDAADPSVSASMFAKAAGLVWQYRKKDRTKEADKLFRKALAADPSSVRAARLFVRTLAARSRHKDIAEVLDTTSQAAKERDDKVNLALGAGRVFSRDLEQPDDAARCYERVLDFIPGQEESLRFLVEYFTQREDWDHLVALYEDALRSRQKLESEQGILLQIGMVHWRIRSAPAEAEPYFSRLRKLSPANPGMLDFYREYLGRDDASEEEKSRLVTILGDAQRVAEDADRLTLAIELARSASGSGQNERAIDAWKAVLRIDGTNEEAGTALRELYRRAEKWNALVELLRAEVDSLEGDEHCARRVTLLRELITIYRDELKLDVMVINTYQRLLEERPGDREAISELAATYEQAGRWNDLIQVLNKQAEAEEDATHRADLYLRVARLWIDRFANFNQASKPLEALLEVDPSHREAIEQLKVIYTKKRSWKQLFGVLGKEVELLEDPAERLALQTERARIAGDRLHKSEDAIALWREVLAAEPRVEGGLDSLIKLSERSKDWASLAFGLSLRADQEAEDGVPEKARIKTLHKLGTTYGEHLEQPAEAAAAFQRVLEIDPKNGRALRTLREAYVDAEDWDGLESFYGDLGDWEGLVDVLGKAADKADDVEKKVALSFRTASIYTDKIGQPERAFRSYERVLAADPENVRAAEALLPIYEGSEQWSRLAAMHTLLYRALPEDTSAEDRLDALARLHDLAHDKLSDEAGAFAWAEEAFSLAPTEATLKQRLEVAAGRAAKHEEVVAHYQMRIEEIGDADDDEVVELRRRIADIASQHLGQAEEAITQLRGILAARPEDAEAAELYERVLGAEGKHGELREFLLERLEQLEDPELRRGRLAQLAELEETVLEDRASAIERYGDILEIDATDDTALRALDRLNGATQQWKSQHDILERRLELADDAAERGDLGRRIGSLRAGPLGDAPGALRAYVAVLEERLADDEALEGARAQLGSVDDAERLEATPTLERAFELRSDAESLMGSLRWRLDNTTDEADRHDLQLRLAEIAASDLGDPQAAFRALVAAFKGRPEDTLLWDRLATTAEAADKNEELATAFAEVVESGSLSDADSVQLAAKTAEIYDVLLGRPKEGEPFHRRVLTAEPLDERAFGALKQLYTDDERWDDLQALYRGRIDEIYETDAKLELLQQLCFLFEELLDSPERAISAYREILELEPEHAATRRALDRLYRRTESWADLAAHLVRELELSDEERAQLDLRLEIAAIQQDRLGEIHEAVENLERILEQQPAHFEARQRLETILAAAEVPDGEDTEEDAEPDELRQRVASILEPIYEQQSVWNELDRILEVRLEALEGADAFETLRRLAALRRDRLHDETGAYDALARAIRIEPGDGELRQELGALAARLDAWDAHAAVLAQVVDDLDGRSFEQLEVLVSLSAVQDERLGDHSAAAESYEKIVELDPTSPDTALPALEALERIHLGSEEHGKLAEDLVRQVGLVFDADARGELLARLARLREDVLEDVEGAIAAYRDRLEVLPDDLDALVALERLHRSREEWSEVVEVLRGQETRFEEGAEQSDVLFRMGQVQEQELEDAEAALATYEDIRARFGDQAEALTALARLYRKTERWEELLEVFEVQEAQSYDDAIRRELAFQRGEVLRAKVGSGERALEAYRMVLALSPGDPATVAALEAMAADPDETERIAAAQLLVPVYEAEGNAEALVRNLERVAQTEEPAEKLDALRRAAAVAERELGDTAQALVLASRAMRAAATEPDGAPFFEEVDRLSARAEKREEFVALVEELAPDVLDEELQARMLRRVGSVARDELESGERARALYERALLLNPDDLEALDALDGLHELSEDYGALVEVLRRKTELASEPERRIALLVRRGRVASEHLNDTDAAVEAYEDVLSEEPEHVGAYSALASLYERKQRWPDVAAILERQVDALAGDVVATRYRLADVHARHLDDPHVAVEQFSQALAMDPDHGPSVDALEALLEDERVKADAAKILEDVFIGRSDWQRAVGAIEAHLDATDDPDDRRQLFMRLGSIREESLEDLEGALETYARLFKEDPRDLDARETLARLAKNLEAWERLGTVYGEVVEEAGGVVDDDTADLAREAGRIFSHEVGRPGNAAGFYEKLLEFEPTDDNAFHALDAAYVTLERWDELEQLLQRRVEVAEPAEQRECHHRIAQLREQQLERPEDALDAYRRALDLDAQDVRAAEEIDRLLTSFERWPELGEHLRFRAEESTGETRAAHLHRLAELRVQKLDEVGYAVDTLEELTQEYPGYGPAIASLEHLVLNRDHQVRITEILEPIYRESDEWRKLIAILEARVGFSEDAVERVPLLSEIGQLHEHRGRDYPRALHAWRRAFASDPADEEPRAEVERLTHAAQDWDGLVAAYRDALAATEEPTVRAPIYAALAAVYDQRMGDPRAAIEAYEALTECDPDDVSALDALEALHMMVGDWDGLVRVLERKVERSYDAEERGELLRRAGSIVEELAEDPERAVGYYKRASEEDPNDEVALEALDRLYESSAKNDDLADVLRRRLELTTDVDEKVGLGMRLAEVFDTRLEQPDQAIGALEDVLIANPEQSQALERLGGLYERRGMWSELLDNIRERAAQTTDDRRKVELLHRAGEILERQLDDMVEALEAFRGALAVEGRHEPSIQALLRIGRLEEYRAAAAEVLEPLFEVQERWDQLAELLESKVEASSDPFDKKEQLLKLAEVHQHGRLDRGAAFDAVARALAQEPGDFEVVGRLEGLAASEGAWARFAEVLELQAPRAMDPTAAAEIYVRLARISEGELSDPKRAIDAYRRALEQLGDDDALLAELDRLLKATEDWNGLGPILERRVDLATVDHERHALLLRLGALRERHYSDPRGAFSAYQEVVAANPHDEAATAALERLGANEDLAIEVVDTLEEAYRSAGNLAKVVGLYDLRLNLVESDAERVDLLREAARLWENDLGDPAAALRSVVKAAKLEPREVDLFDEVERLAGLTGGWESTRGLVEEVVSEDQGDLDSEVVRDLHLRAAVWYRDGLGDATAAEAMCRGALAADEESVEAHEMLVALCRVGGRELELADALANWAAIEFDAYAKVAKLKEAARLQQIHGGASADLWVRVLDADAADVDALDSLRVIRAGAGEWPEVVTLLERRIDVEDDETMRGQLRRELAGVLGEQVQDRARAIEVWESLLYDAPEDMEVIEALEGLYEGEERWDDLRELLDRRLELATEAPAQIAVRVRLARLAERAFGERGQAIEQLRGILEIDPLNLEALDELERLQRAEESWDEVAEILGRRLSATGSAEQPAVLWRLAEVHQEHRASGVEALQVYEEILGLVPEDAEAMARVVAIHESASDWPQTLHALERQQAQFEAAGDIDGAVGVCGRIATLAEGELGDLESAERALRRAHELAPTTESREALQGFLEKHERWEGVAELLEQEVATLEDSDAKAGLLRQIAEIHEQKREDPAAAAMALERAVEFTPDDREVLLPLCDLYIAAGRSSDAVPVLQKIIESFGGRRSKELARYQHRLGRALEGLGDDAGAMAAYDAAFKVDLTNVGILRDLGKLCHRTGDLNRAQKTFRALLLQKLDGTQGISKADVYFYLGDIAHKEGDARKASSMLERAVGENANHEEAKALLASIKG